MKIMKELAGASDNEDVISLLESIDPEKASQDELRALVRHLKYQFKNRYRYLVGEWRNSHRVKSTINGRFVKVEEVIGYLREKEE